MTSRTHQTILLLNTLQDAQPAPTTWTGNLVQRQAQPGPSPSRWQRCETCDGAGVTLDRFKRSSPCTLCAGHGRYLIDDYTSQRVSTLEHGLIDHRKTVRCDRCSGDGVWKFKRCELCEGTGRRTATTRELATSHETTRQRNTDHLWGRNGSYHELERALHQLNEIARPAHFQVWHVHVLRDLHPDEAPLLELSLTFIVTRMPTPILVPAGASTAEKRAHAHQLKVKGRHTDPRARQARDTEIRKLHRHGKPVQWIAQQTGLSVSSVYDILAQREHAAA
jgi:hypothetical protein